MSSYGLWLSAAGMKVNEHRQALLANNMANAQTTGFKHDFAVVMQRRVESKEDPGGLPFAHPVLDGLPGGLNVLPAYHSAEQGPIEWTGKPLDVAIQGEGFFAVSDGEATRYTRNGEFTTNAQGELVMANEAGRWRVLDEGGAPMRVDEAGGEVEVSDSGTVRQGNTVLGKIGLMTNDDPRSLRKVGENLFEAAGGEMKPAKGRLIPGSREGSTFDAMQGLATMIEASRAYQMNASMIQLQDQLTQQAVTTLGRVA
jgi:flagellar basal-body rod protein FlgF